MNDGDGGDGNKGGGEPSVTELQATVASLKGQMGEIEKAKAALGEKVGDYEKTFMSKEWMDFIDTQKGGDGEDGDGDKTPISEGKVDLNNLNPTQLAEHLSKSFGVALGKIKADSDRQTADMQAVLVQQLSRVNLELTKLEYPDLKGKLGPKERKSDEQSKYYDHYFGVAKANPAWDGAKVYKQVEMELARDAHAVKTAEAEKAEKEKKALTEHAVDGVSPSAVTGKKLSSDEAADLAFEETMADTGD